MAKIENNTKQISFHVSWVSENVNQEIFVRKSQSLGRQRADKIII